MVAPLVIAGIAGLQIGGALLGNSAKRKAYNRQMALFNQTKQIMEQSNALENKMADEMDAQSIARDMATQSSSGFETSDFKGLNIYKERKIAENKQLRLNNQQLQLLQLQSGLPTKPSLGQDLFNATANIFTDVASFSGKGGSATSTTPATPKTS